MSWSSQKEEFRICEEFLRNPTRNPETGRTIELGGKKYKEFIERCKKVGLCSKPVSGNIPMTKELCRQFAKNPNINPKTGKHIAVGGPTFKKLMKECKNCKEPENQIQGTYPTPDSDGFVLVTQEHHHYFIIRTLPDRKVYGQLNKFVSGDITTKKVYYKYTWDYKQGHYRPIFMNGKAPIEPKSNESKASGFFSTQNPKLITKKETGKNPKYLVDSVLDIFITRET